MKTNAVILTDNIRIELENISQDHVTLKITIKSRLADGTPILTEEVSRAILHEYEVIEIANKRDAYITSGRKT